MFARAPTFYVGACIFGLRIICVAQLLLERIICVAQLLLELRIFLERRHFAIDADILGRQHFE